MSDTAGVCPDCGAIFDAGAVDDCPVCAQADMVDVLMDDVSDLKTAVDQLFDRIPRGDD